MESIIFLYSRGAHTRRKIIQTLYKQSKVGPPHYLSTLTDFFPVSKVALKKHVDYLTELGYIDKINPGGKPVYLQLTEKGVLIAKKYILL